MAFGAKKICPVCGQPVKGVFTLKIKDKTAICSDCANEIDMDNSMIINQTPESIKAHIEYRRKNKETFSNFNTTYEIKAGSMYFRADANLKLWYYSSEKKPKNPPLFKYGEIVEYEFSEDGETITKGGLGRAVAGGLLFGAAGAVVGGATGKRKSKQEITSMAIRVAISNPYHTGLTVELIPAGTKYKTNSFTYNAFKQTANDLMSFLGSLKAQAEATSAPSGSSNDVVEQIEKLSALRDKGILSEEEFQAKKQELLAKI